MTVIPIIYDGDVDASEITYAVAEGARYFYNVEDTGGDWYVILACREEIQDVQQAWKDYETEMKEVYGR